MSKRVFRVGRTLAFLTGFFLYIYELKERYVFEVSARVFLAIYWGAVSAQNHLFPREKLGFATENQPVS